MPRKSAASLATVAIDAREVRLIAPTDLSAAAAKIWQSIVASTSPEHFRTSDVPLLKTFVEASALADRARAALVEDGPILEGKVSPWLKVQEASVRSQATLAVRLRLCPSSRIDPKTAGRAKGGSLLPDLPWKGRAKG